MKIVAVVAGAVIVGIVMLDAFETVILPRQVKRRFRLGSVMFAIGWPLYRQLARHIRHPSRRDTMLSYVGPSTILFLLAVWAFGIIGGFTLVHWGLGSHIVQMSGGRSAADDLYMSGTTFFTLGLGDIAPVTAAERIVTVLEAGIGLGFLAIVISYLPVLYQTFSKREVFVNRLDILAGAPPTPGVILRRYSSYGPPETRSLLENWQHWSAELMDSMQSYPVLAFYRSQHHDQSWLTALTAILDTSALISCDPSDEFGESRDAAEVAFALASHAARDVCDVVGGRVNGRALERPAGIHRDHVLGWMRHRGLPDSEVQSAEASLDALRARYEPFVATMSQELLMPLPAFCPECTPAHHEH